MSTSDGSKTSATLLGRLTVSPPEQTAWNGFVDRYSRRIFDRCRAWGLQGADIADVIQMVLTKLLVQMPEFRYNPAQCFQCFLRTLVQHAVHDALSARRRQFGSGASEI